nr:hypothetical protein [Rhizohabitans arisaemae]
MLTFDPEGLSRAQRAGRACAVCRKRWPRPRVEVGFLPDGRPVYVCEDCANAIILDLEEITLGLYHDDRIQDARREVGPPRLPDPHVHGQTPA